MLGQSKKTSGGGSIRAKRKSNNGCKDFLTANGFTPRYGEAQGVTRRVLTYDGISLVSAAIVGGSAYLIVRHKRKKKAALLEIAEAEK